MKQAKQEKQVEQGVRAGCRVRVRRGTHAGRHGTVERVGDLVADVTFKIGRQVHQVQLMLSDLQEVASHGKG